MDKQRMAEAQKAVYLEAYMAQQAAQQAALQQQQQQQKSFRYPETPDEKQKKAENGCSVTAVGGAFLTGLKVPQPANVDATFTVPDDGLGYDDGVRVLRTLGSWTPEYAGLPTRPTPGVLFAEIPYAHPEMTTTTGSLVTSNSTVTTPSSSMQRKPPITAAVPRPVPKKDTLKPNGVSTTGNKSFTCTICGKALARKDKLVIHTRIHTGEKPYVCEVCDKAFARRDKLVIHMNKMKHRTPSNVAPLGKRGDQETKRAQILTPFAGGSSSVEKTKSKQTEGEEETGQKAAAVAAAALLHSAVTNWSCELCGQMMTTREEWMVHAKAHLEEKVTGIGVIAPGNYVSTPTTPSAPPPAASATPYQHPPTAYQPFLPERHYCPVCRQSFSAKPEFMVHVRGHFDGSGSSKPSHDDAHLEPLEPPPTSSSALCS